MATLKCKMCGGNLEVVEGTTVCECEYCGTTQTVPKVQDDVTSNLFNRANNLRMKSEFDKAQEIYEKIVSQNENESEAYWGIVLCKFGIEYVEDPATFKKIPTCHRTQLESVLTDVDYLAAIEHADISQKTVYEDEAKEIDKLQHDILEIVHKEEPFDVFICYKETDENGKRTQDSVIANDIYHQLTLEGFKVFYAAITLEDKLGQAYEPYIFAALTSAKVMLAIGTKPEYFSAVWVKNEWSRYLKLMKNDRSKLLIPCYKDMDAYDLPEEFSHLQAQDMAKIGFMQDLIRGIKKIASVDEPKVVKQENVVVQSEGNANITVLLKRAKMALEDEEYNKVDDFCEQVLNMDAENAEAYLYKLMTDLKVAEVDNLKNCSETFDCNKNYKKAYRYGSAELKTKLDNDINEILYKQAVSAENRASNEKEYYDAADRFKKVSAYNDSASRTEQCIERAKECAYQEAEKAFNKADNEGDFKVAADLYRHISGYKDSDEKVEKSIEAGKKCVYQVAECKFEKADNEDDFKEAADIYRHVSGYKDSDQKVQKCLEKAEICRKDDIYGNAYAYSREDIEESLEKAVSKFESIKDYKDSAERIEKCKARIAEIQAENAERAERVRLNAEKEERERIAAEEKAKKKKKIGIISAVAAVAIIIGVGVTTYVIIPSVKYNNAVALMESGSYDEATEVFENLGDYKDSRTMSLYNKALSLLESGSYDDAIKVFTDLSDCSDSKEKAIEVLKKTFAVGAVKKGDKIEFGKYTWRILDIQSNSAMLITDEVIDEMQYYSEWKYITWKQSTIRQYLNSEFYNTFSEEEKAVIKETDIVNNNNPEYGTTGGENTKDKIFLLSIDEVNKYFASDNDRVAYYNGDPCSWWLRSPGFYRLNVARVLSNGSVNTSGGDVNRECGIRPVLNLEF